MGQVFFGRVVLKFTVQVFSRNRLACHNVLLAHLTNPIVTTPLFLMQEGQELNSLTFCPSSLTMRYQSLDHAEMGSSLLPCAPKTASMRSLR